MYYASFGTCMGSPWWHCYMTCPSTVPGSFWIGLNSRRQTRSYEWSDNSDVTFTQPWGPGEPNNQLDGAENCVVFNEHGVRLFFVFLLIYAKFVYIFNFIFVDDWSSITCKTAIYRSSPSFMQGYAIISTIQDRAWSYGRTETNISRVKTFIRHVMILVKSNLC